MKLTLLVMSPFVVFGFFYSVASLFVIYGVRRFTRYRSQVLFAELARTDAPCVEFSVGARGSTRASARISVVIKHFLKPGIDQHADGVRSSQGQCALGALGDIARHPNVGA